MSASHHNTTPNALIHEKSPYLLQHAYNPVQWMPWSDTAFKKAAREEKPIFLSIGYSTCHWCHVMAHESFEDQEVADLLNTEYIAIKVDREERPDIDHIYMTVCEQLTGQGGWPLTVLLTPDKKPFYAGTYFPKREKWGRPGVMEILGQIADMWHNDRNRILESSEQITDAMQPHYKSHREGVLSADTLRQGSDKFKRTFDEEYGGFGDQPKFPTPHNLLFLLRESKRTGDRTALDMVETTLRAMHEGGIYDHLGYGFARYSVDERWLVPHFEKMLYDNALLAYTYLETYQATQNEEYAHVAREIFQYVERVMTDSLGGFYSAEDADSEGVEGKFYIWTREEIDDLLNDSDLADLFCEVYDVTGMGNFEGHNILNLIQRDLPAIAADYGLTTDELQSRLAPARQTLFEAREERVHPHKDDKILTSWNALMIAALAKGAAVLQEPHLLHLAQRAAAFIEDRLVNADGRLLARYREGEANFLAYLDDHAFYAWALHELYFASGDLKYLERATQIIDETIRLFWDEKDHGFFIYGSDAEELLARPKEIYDGAIPSGNGVMALILVRHNRLTGDIKYATYADQLLGAFSGQVGKYPAGHTFTMLALQLAVGEPQEIVLAEGDNIEEYARMMQHVQTAHLPFAVTIYRGHEQAAHLARLAPAHADKGPVNGQSALYLCQNFTCKQPLTSTSDVEQQLQ